MFNAFINLEPVQSSTQNPPVCSYSVVVVHIFYVLIIYYYKVTSTFPLMALYRLTFYITVPVHYSKKPSLGRSVYCCIAFEMLFVISFNLPVPSILYHCHAERCTLVYE